MFNKWKDICTIYLVYVVGGSMYCMTPPFLFKKKLREKTGKIYTQMPYLGYLRGLDLQVIFNIFCFLLLSKIYKVNMNYFYIKKE